MIVDGTAARSESRDRDRAPGRLLFKAVLIVVVGVAGGTVFHAATAGQAFTGPSPPGEIVSLAQARTAIDDHSTVFLDARRLVAYEEGHIPGARSLPLYEFEQAVERAMVGVSRSTAIITYCEGVSCDSAARLAVRLVRAGYRNIRAFPQGWEAWRAAGYPARGGQTP